MSNMPATISPRRRSRVADAPAPAISPAPANELESPPRVLVRLPAIAAAAPTPAAKPATPASSAISIGRSATPLAADAPWYARLYTPRVQKYLPYATAFFVLAIGVVLMIRSHAGKSRPVAADSEAPIWNNGAAVPHGQFGGLTPPVPANVPNWNGPALPASNGVPLGTTPNGSGTSPSAYQTTPAGPQVAAQNDAVPPMPARSPTWGNSPGGSGVAQGAPLGPEYRTAQANDPATIPPGSGATPPYDPGVARFQGTITRPQ